ncbi:MAG: aminotransferase class V-fold PLP-dependent enzyme [Nocardioides sp.]
MRDAFSLDPSLVHLNHGSFGAVPRVVSEAQQRIRERAEANPMRFFRVDSPDLKAQAREVAAAFLGVGADEVAMVRNVTQATSTILSSLTFSGRLGPRDVIVTGEQGYESVRRSVVHWCERSGATHEVVRFPLDADDTTIVSAFRSVFDEVGARGGQVRLVVTDHITSPTGAVLPAVRITAAAREVGALSFVDAAHVPGQLPADPVATGADFWSGTWHKWGFAPRGTSALWVADSERPGLQPLTTSWNHGMAFPWPFDTYGTDDYSAWFSLEAAIGFWAEAGGPGIADRASTLLDKGAATVAGALPPVDAPVPASAAPCLRLVPLPAGVGTTTEAAAELYEKLSVAGVEAQVTAYGGQGYIRLSGAVYNELADYERLAEVLPAALVASHG